MQVNQGETWRFEVDCRGAERVYLVREPDVGPSAWFEMSSPDGAHWELTHRLPPGRYRFRYFRADGGTFLNCGDHGLTRYRVGEAAAALDADPDRYAVPA